MKYFHVELDLICPSNWTAEDCKAYLHKSVATTDEERDSIRISEAARSKVPLEQEGRK